MDNDQQKIPETAHYIRIKRELILTLLLGVLVYMLSSRYDILESIVVLAKEHESWEIDEMITVAIFMVSALSVFSLRRWRELVASEKKLLLQNKELQEVLKEIRQLKGILPICASCKKIRDDEGYWHQVEVYVRDHSEAEFSHSICPDCMKKLYPRFVKDDSGGKRNSGS